MTIINFGNWFNKFCIHINMIMWLQLSWDNTNFVGGKWALIQRPCSLPPKKVKKKWGWGFKFAFVKIEKDFLGPNLREISDSQASSLFLAFWWFPINVNDFCSLFTVLVLGNKLRVSGSGSINLQQIVALSINPKML